MLIGGFLGEAEILSRMPAFIIGMAGWFAVYFVFMGPMTNINSSGNKASQTAFKALRLIVLVGWAIYPVGYYLNGLGASHLTNIVYVLRSCK